MIRAGHVALSVSSLKRSVAFYRRHFGLRCTRRYRHGETGLTIALLKKGDINLELFEFKKRRLLPSYRRELDSDLRTLGVKHFSLEVSDIDAVYRKLKKARVSFAAGMGCFDDGSRYFFIRDPDGILVELMQPV